MPNTQQITAESLSCVRGEQTLFQNLHFTVKHGEALHITGANGSGKTSLLRILCGISEADTGAISWNDQPIRNNPSYLNNRAYIGHKDGLKNELTAIENLRFYQRLLSINNETQLDQALANMQILHCADLSTYQLSFGQRRRLAFARLLLSHMPCWILDEPFTGIDIEGRALIEKRCKRHLEQNGLIILTHHQNLERSAIADHLRVLSL